MKRPAEYHPIPVFSSHMKKEMTNFKGNFLFPEHMVVDCRYPHIKINQETYKLAALIYQACVPEYYHCVANILKRQEGVHKMGAEVFFYDYMVRESIQRAIYNDRYFLTNRNQ